jgi:serine/threonine-protein kinase RsbW
MTYNTETIMGAKQNIRRTTNSSISAPFVELHQTLTSRAAAVSPFLDQLMRFIRLSMGKFGAAKKDEDGIQIALGEALANAVIHGNHENPEKQVHVTCRCSMDAEVVLTVRDEGEGFDSDAVPDPTGPQGRLLSHGRGLHLMRTLMDEISFEESGTVVRMQKRMKTSIG